MNDNEWVSDCCLTLIKEAQRRNKIKNREWQSAPKTTSPMSQYRKNWFRLVKIVLNLLHQIEKKSPKILFGLVCQNVFDTDWGDNMWASDCCLKLCDQFFNYLMTEQSAYIDKIMPPLHGSGIRRVGLWYHTCDRCICVSLMHDAMACWDGWCFDR